MSENLSVKYKEYLSQGNRPKNKHSNVRNLFDDLNTVDMHWLKITLNYIEQKI